MKVFFCKGSFAGSVSGADEIMVNYAIRLRAAGYEPSVLITCAFEHSNPYYNRLCEAGVPIRCLARHPLYLGLLAVRKILLLIPRLSLWHQWERLLYWTALFHFKLRRPDIVHTLVDAGFYIRVSHAAGIPVLYQEMVTPWYDPKSESKTYYDRLSDVLPLCSEVTALSPSIAQMCGEQLPCPHPVSVLPLIADAPPSDWITPALPSESVTFGFAARMEWRKGPTVLLDAFALLLGEVPDAKLRMAGSGEQQKEVVAQAASIGAASRCDFPGAYTSAEQKTAFLRSIDVFVLSSFAEGTPNSVIEAMAYGLPIIATAVGGVADIVSEDVGILVPAGDTAALSEAMLRLAKDAQLRKKMGQASRERFEKLFSAEAVLPVLQQTYNRVVARHKLITATEANHSHPWVEAKGLYAAGED